MLVLLFIKNTTMESIISSPDAERKDTPETLDWLRSELYTRLKEQWRLGKLPLSDIAKELEKHPKVSYLYYSETINPNDQRDREWKFMDTDSKDFKQILGFIHGDEKDISEQEKSSYLTFEKKDNWMLVNLVKIEPSNVKWLMWVKKFTVKEFADFTHRHN